jgi:putative PIG3 family NAD(P)H quinone oxidoreductase
MKAVFIEEFGGAEKIAIRDVPEPAPPEGAEVLVNVRAAALNRADLLQRQGLYPAPAGYPERIPGLEFAGTVVETGSEARDFKAGERVFGITAGGAQAEFITIDRGLLSRMPENLDFIGAAAVPEAFVTAHDALFTQARLAAGETLLIHAVGSGVGLAALQLAKANGARVAGTSRTQSKLDRCIEFGLDFGLLTGRDTDFAEELGRIAGWTGVDVVLDLVGAKFFAGNLRVLNTKGRLALVGLVGGRRAEFDLGMALSKRLSIFGTVLRSRSVEEKAAATRAFATFVIPLLASGAVRPNVDSVFPADEVRAAHEYLESNESFGKVVLEF